jgi:WD40 repeat protein
LILPAALAGVFLAGGLPAPARGADPLALPPGAVRRFGGERFRVAGSPLASALSADGTRLAVLGYAEGRDEVVLTIFDADMGRPLCRGIVVALGVFPTPRLAFSPDGKYVAAAINPEVRAVWAAATGECVTKLPPTRSPFALCQFTPEGLLAVTGPDRTDLYEVPSGKLARTWPAGRIARLTRDARTFARVEPDLDAVSLGDPATGQVSGTLAVKTLDSGRANGLAFSANGKLLAVIHGLKFRQLQVWDTATRKKLAEAKVPDSAVGAYDLEPDFAVSFSPDGRCAVLETKRGVIERWDARSLTPLPPLVAAGASHIDAGAIPVRGVHWSGDGRTILAVAGNGLVHRWDARTGERFPDDGCNSRLHFALTPDGSSLVVGDRIWRIDVWDVATGRIVRRLHEGPGREHALVRLAVSPDGRRVAAGEGHCDVWLYRTDGGKDGGRLFAGLRLDGGWMHFLAWAPDGKSLYADGSGMILCRVSVVDGKIVWGNGDENMPAFALAPDGRSLVKTLHDGIQFLDAATGEVTSTVRMAMTPEQTSMPGPLRAIAFAPDGTQFALALGQNTVVVCDRAGKELRRFVAAGRKRWLAPQLMARELYEAFHRVEALAFTPDGKWIVSGADDCSVRVWEAVTGRQVVRFDGHDSAVGQVAVAPDGRSAFSAGGDGFVCQWDLTPGPYPRPGQQPADLWRAAADPDPALAVPAAWALVSRSGESRAFVAEKLPPCAGAKPGEIAKALADLDSPVFAEREAASTALATQGRVVEGHLKEVLKTTASLEVRRRAGELLARIAAGYTEDELRALRLVQACELSGTLAARALLRRWAGGAAGAVLTEDARAALARLGRRPS